jgi:3-isopropylmalate/(R)-2-methylmalate dehydratase large subunit
MKGKTISEKILSEKSGRDARAGDVVVCTVDCAMATDGSAPMAIHYFEQMGGTRVRNPEHVVFVMDHYVPGARAKTVEFHEVMARFAGAHGITIHNPSEGICHQLMLESGRTRPGGLLVGADSHSVTGGALNAFATGIGSSDFAAALICGHIWLKVPHTIKVRLEGRPVTGVYPKDIALAIAGRIGADGAGYQAIEFDGPAAADMNVAGRAVLSNMSVEMGAKAGIFRTDDKTIEYLEDRTCASFNAVEPDADARYSGEIMVDVSEIGPMVALPHAVDNVAGVDATAATPIQMVFLGTCTGGRICDFHEACRVLDEAGGIAADVQLVAAPASREVETELRRDGTLDRLASMGAIVLPPGCGPCCGTSGPIPTDGVNILSTANRNFKARMGNGTAAIFLASPASCAAAAATGRITDPREYGGGK